MLREIKCQGNLVNWKMSQIAGRRPPPPPPLTSLPERLLSTPPTIAFTFLKYVFVFLCVSVCECVWRDLGELLERYHRVGGGRWSVSERAVRTCCPARLDSHPWNVSARGKNSPPQQPPIYTAIFHSLATELNRICLPAVDTTLPWNFIHIQLISTSSPGSRKSNHWTERRAVIYYSLLQFIERVGY